MKKLSILFLVLVVSGCTSVSIPNYIYSKNPYKKTFYAGFDETYQALTETLHQLGWRIESKVDPAVYEQSKTLDDPQGRHTLVFTDVRQTGLFIGSRYARMNVYMRTSADRNAIEMEVRYVTVTSLPFKSFSNYTNDGAIERFFKLIDAKINL